MRRERRESGQALVEFALFAPVLLLVLGGVVYCGGMALAQQNLAVAARSVARTVAMQAEENGLKNTNGHLMLPGSGNYAAALQQVDGHSDAQVGGVNWGAIRNQAHGTYDWKQINGNTAEQIFRANLRIDGKSYQAGLGVMYYGVTLNRPLRELGGIGQHLAGVISKGVSATSIMPAVVPARGDGGGTSAEGLLEMNTWIGRIVNENVSDQDTE